MGCCSPNKQLLTNHWSGSEARSKKKNINKIVKLLHHGLESKRSAIQLKSVFLTLFSSLSCALESFGVTSSTEPWTLSSCWLSHASISSSDSSSSFSLSISCSEESISSLKACQKQQKKKHNLCACNTEHLRKREGKLRSHVNCGELSKNINIHKYLLCVWTKYLRGSRWTPVLEIRRELTNIEHRTDAAGRTWAGVCNN